MRNHYINENSSRLKTYYRVLSPMGELLSYTNERRFHFFIKNKIGNLVDDRTIKLNQLRTPVNNVCRYNQTSKHNKCVVCNSSKQLSKHHVMPRLIFSQLPVLFKTHASMMLVLVCSKCNENAEELLRPMYKEYNLEFHSYLGKELETLKTLKMIKASMASGKWNYFSENRKLAVLKRTNISSLDELENTITPMILEEAEYKLHLKTKSFKKEYAKSFILNKGGLVNTLNYFVGLFLTLSPKYLNDGELDIDDYMASRAT